MTEDDQPWAQPPDWVPYGDLPTWLARHHGMPGSEPDFFWAMIHGLRTWQLSHAIIETYLLPTIRITDPSDNIVPVPFVFGDGNVVVKNWNAASVNWQDGTVGGPSRHGGMDRYTLSIKWDDAVQWSLTEAVLGPILRKYRQRSESIKAPAATRGAPEQLPLDTRRESHKQVDQREMPSRGRGGGRPPHTAQDAFIRELVRHADLDSLSEDRHGLIKHMTEWAAREFDAGAPSDTTIKDWLRRFVGHKPNF